ncbi:MerR family DNA-binding transcriptional regulator [Streptomyces noursei]
MVVGTRTGPPPTGRMRIGALARRTGVSTRVLRYYEQRGLLRALRSG